MHLLLWNGDAGSVRLPWPGVNRQSIDQRAHRLSPSCRQGSTALTTFCIDQSWEEEVSMVGSKVGACVLTLGLTLMTLPAGAVVRLSFGLYTRAKPTAMVEMHRPI